MEGLQFTGIVTDIQHNCHCYIDIVTESVTYRDCRHKYETSQVHADNIHVMIYGQQQLRIAHLTLVWAACHCVTVSHSHSQ